MSSSTRACPGKTCAGLNSRAALILKGIGSEDAAGANNGADADQGQQPRWPPVDGASSIAALPAIVMPGDKLWRCGWMAASAAARTLKARALGAKRHHDCRAMVMAWARLANGRDQGAANHP